MLIQASNKYNFTVRYIKEGKIIQLHEEFISEQGLMASIHPPDQQCKELQFKHKLSLETRK